MTHALNEITGQGAAHLAEFYQQILSETEQPLSKYEANFNLGLLAWRAGDMKMLCQYLGEAAKQAIGIIEQRDSLNLQAERIPHSVALPFLVVFNFGTKDDLQRLANIKRNQIIQPENKRYKSLADLLDVLRGYSHGSLLASEKLEVILKDNEHPETDNFYKPWVAALTKGLQGIAENNEILVEKSMRYLLQLHEQLAREGGWQKLAEGLLSFWALSLQTVAKQENIKLQIESPYVPRG
jgi:hypothetical protein